MSGRLIILPKKSYCPWNSKNVERVLRDEREHAEATERAAKEVEKASSLNRLEALKKRKREQSRSGENPVEEKGPQHFNLFAREEEEHKKRVDTAVQGPSRKQEKQQHGVVPLYLGQSVNEDAFYLQKTGGSSARKSDQESKYSDRREEERKDEMDPMRVFASSNQRKTKAKANPPQYNQQKTTPRESKQNRSRKDRRERDDRTDQKRSRSHSSNDHASTPASSSDDDSSTGKKGKSRHQKERSRSRKHRHSRTSSKKLDPSTDELRRRRAEREDAERLRQNEVLQEESRKARFSGYQNQYHPSLSRK